MSAPHQAVPNNASLAYAVDDKDLQKTKKKLDHVDLKKAPTTQAGGVHVGPGEKQADFGPQEVGKRSAEAAAREAALAQPINNLAVRRDITPSAGGEVSVQSSVVMDTTQTVDATAGNQIQSLLSRLSSTTQQVDEYSRRQNEAISAEANERVQRIIAETQLAQDALLRDASARSLEIEGEYASKLKAFLQQLDASKASNLAALEKDLNFRQEQLIADARSEMDRIHAAATTAKIAAMTQANAAVSRDVDQLTNQVRALGEAEVERRMNSTTTTVITTQTSTEGGVRSSPDVLADKAALQSDLVNADLRAQAAGEPRANVRV